jgi:hypothetical protein
MPLNENVKVTAKLLARAGHWNLMEQIAVAEKLVELSYDLTQALNEISSGPRPSGLMRPNVEALKWDVALAMLRTGSPDVGRSRK